MTTFTEAVELLETIDAAWIAGYETGYAHGVNARHTEAEMVPIERENLPYGEIEIRVGMPVYSKNGAHIGHVDEIALDSTSGRFTHFLMAHRHLLDEKGYVVGSWQLKSITEDGIYLKIDEGEIGLLPTMALKHHA